MRRMVAALLGAALFLTVSMVSGPATAAAAAETRIVDLTGSEVVYQQSPSPWLSGRLVTAAGEPVAGAEVRIEHPVGEESDFAATTTGDDGTFSLSDFSGPRPGPETTTPYAFNGVYRAHFLGSDAYQESSATITLESDRLGTRLRVDPPPAGPYAVGSTVPVSGSLELEQADGTWARPATGLVRVIRAAWGSGVDSQAVNVVDGRFSYDLPIVNVRNESDGFDGGTFFGAIYDGGTANDYQRVIWGPIAPVVSDVVKVKVGRTVRGKTTKISVRVKTAAGSPLPGLPVIVESLESPNGRPTFEAKGTTTATGRYRVTVPVWSDAIRFYRVEVLGSTAAPVRVPVTVSHTVNIKGLTAPATVPPGTAFTVTGTVETLASADWPIPSVGSTVTLAWSTDKETWHDYGSQVLGFDGVFTFQPVPSATAYWRVTATGDDSPGGLASTPDHKVFRVRVA